MRRLRLLALVGLFLLPPGVGATPLEKEGPRAVKVQEVWADFYVTTGPDTFDWYVLTARRELDILTGQVLKKTGRVARGTCEGPTPIEADCGARSHWTRVERFSVTDDFSRAIVVLQDRRYEHRLTFGATGRFTHTPTIYDVECKPTVDFFTEAWGARARGTLYGRRFSTAGEPRQSIGEHMTERIFVENCL